MIFHLTDRAHWLEEQKKGRYRHPSLEQEGFIHCSTKEQIAATARNYFCGKRDLILLELNPDRIRTRLCWENTTGGNDLFPHLYGPVNLDAVTGTTRVDRGENGVLMAVTRS